MPGIYALEIQKNRSTWTKLIVQKPLFLSTDGQRQTHNIIRPQNCCCHIKINRMSGLSQDLREHATDIFHVDMDVTVVTKVIYYLRLTLYRLHRRCRQWFLKRTTSVWRTKWLISFLWQNCSTRRNWMRRGLQSVINVNGEHQSLCVDFLFNIFVCGLFVVVPSFAPLFSQVVWSELRKFINLL